MSIQNEAGLANCVAIQTTCTSIDLLADYHPNYTNLPLASLLLCCEKRCHMCLMWMTAVTNMSICATLHAWRAVLHFAVWSAANSWTLQRLWCSYWWSATHPREWQQARFEVSNVDKYVRPFLEWLRYLKFTIDPH